MPLSNEERKLRLARVLAVEANNGWKVESQTEYTAVLYYGKGGKINHILHLLLSLITFGIWLVVWISIGLMNQRKTKVIAIDEDGQIIVDFGTVRKVALSEKDRIRFPFYKEKPFWAFLGIVIFLLIVAISSNNNQVPKATNVSPQKKQTTESIERNLTVYDIKNDGFYDDEVGKYFWGATFKVKYISQNVKILCTTEGLNSAGKLVESFTATYNTLGNPGDSDIGSSKTVLYGSDAYYPTTTKNKFNEIEKFNISCSYFD